MAMNNTKSSNKLWSGKKKLFIIIPVVLVILVVVGYVAYRGFKSREKFVFADHLDDTMATIDGEVLTYKDLSFYVLYEENTVEKEAKIYNAESTKDFWNANINGTFVSISSRDAAVNMCIHDKIMYDLAKKNNMSLTEADKAALKNTQSDFWDDLQPQQLEQLPTSKEFINETMEHIALGEKYQQKLVDEEGVNYFEYNYDGYEYNNTLKPKYDIKLDDSIKKLDFGEITLTHNRVNYVNGVNEKSDEPKTWNVK